MRIALVLVIALVATPALAQRGGGYGGRGGHGPDPCVHGHCPPSSGTTMPGGNKGSKCKPNGEGCGKQF